MGSDGYGDYGNNEHCTIKALRYFSITATEFDTESGCDHLTIGGSRYSGSQGPRGLPLAQGTELVWSSDHSVTGYGFKVCVGEPGDESETTDVLELSATTSTST